jgi:thioredoxin 1
MEISQTDFRPEVLESPLPILVAFTSPWSKPCSIVLSVLEDVEQGARGRFKVATVNVDNNPDLGAWYGIESVPTLIWFAHGHPCGRIVGTATKEAILSKLHTPAAQP